jgi:phosphoserine phosphatase
MNVVCTDLDGTIVKNDLFLEAVVRMLQQCPMRIFQFFFWLCRGIGYAKTRVADIVALDVSTLQFEDKFIKYLKDQKKKGAKIILATAAPQQYADCVANYLKIFDLVIATSSQINLKGASKLEAIRKVIGQDTPFIYAGDSVADRPIWRAASGNIFMNAPEQDAAYARRANKHVLSFCNSDSRLKAFMQAVRPHQYIKNILVFVPVFTSHSYFSFPVVVNAAVAFVSFSICASGVYLLNDLFDLDADRRHPTKRCRPLAACRLPIPYALFGAMMMPAFSFAIAYFTLPRHFVYLIVFYYFSTSAYTFFFKKIIVADVVILASLYTIRPKSSGGSSLKSPRQRTGGVGLQRWCD